DQLIEQNLAVDRLWPRPISRWERVLVRVREMGVVGERVLEWRSNGGPLSHWAGVKASSFDSTWARHAQFSAGSFPLSAGERNGFPSVTVAKEGVRVG